MSNSSCSIPAVLVCNNKADKQALPFTLLKSVQLAIAIFALPQIPNLLWRFQAHSSIHFRGYVNVEYLLLFAVSLLFPSWVTLTLLTADLTISLFDPIAHVYYLSPPDAILSLKYLGYIPIHLLLIYGLLVLGYIAGSTGLLRLALSGIPKLPARCMAGLLAVCVICSVSHDFFTGHLFRPTAPVKYGDVDLRAARISVAPIGSMAHATVVAIRNSRQRPDLAVEMPSALGTAIGNIPKMSQPNVVLVLTESWGLARDPRVNEAETEPYRNNEIAQSYDIQSGTVGFLGATTSGETRELCGDSRGRNGESSSYDACWPAVLNRRGYRTLGVHGFAPSMFQRAEWYKEFGFSESAFLPELQRDGAKLCDGVFLGACDSDVASWIGNRLEAEHDGRPMFVHWVTLNSHLPVAAVPGNGARMACNNVGFNPDSSLCAWFNRVLKVQQSVAKLALRPGLSPTVFVIVGDHAPPFLNPAARAQFADRIVPWVILMPRTLTGRQLPHDLVASTSLTHVSGQEHEQQHHGRAAVHLHTRRDKLRVSWRAAG